MRQLRPTLARRPQRHTVRLACQVVRERDFRLVADKLMNLSPTGALVAPADAVMTGEVLLTSFRLPSSSKWIDAEARVCRVIHGRRPGEYVRALGLEFLGLSEHQRWLIEEELLCRPPAPPGMRPGRRVWSGAIRRLGHLSRPSLMLGASV